MKCLDVNGLCTLQALRSVTADRVWRVHVEPASEQQRTRAWVIAPAASSQTGEDDEA